MLIINYKVNDCIFWYAFSYLKSRTRQITPSSMLRCSWNWSSFQRLGHNDADVMMLHHAHRIPQKLYNTLQQTLLRIHHSEWNYTSEINIFSTRHANPNLSKHLRKYQIEVLLEEIPVLPDTVEPPSSFLAATMSPM